jgi:hypothetical protein
MFAKGTPHLSFYCELILFSTNKIAFGLLHGHRPILPRLDDFCITGSDSQHRAARLSMSLSSMIENAVVRRND